MLELLIVDSDSPTLEFYTNEEKTKNPISVQHTFISLTLKLEDVGWS